MNYNYLILIVPSIWLGLFLARMIFIVKFKNKIKFYEDSKEDEVYLFSVLILISVIIIVLSLLILKFFVGIALVVALSFYSLTKEDDISYLDPARYSTFKGKYFMPSVRWSKNNLAKKLDFTLVVISIILFLIFIILDNIN